MTTAAQTDFKMQDSFLLPSLWNYYMHVAFVILEGHETVAWLTTQDLLIHVFKVHVQVLT